ncbi:peroxiredoxin [Methanocaldococcus indicus]|uniref:peroxiredoxin n=1 Tax=Methanocaldococcus indicus TaxID=213231 RepID=UPI003C6D23B8
MCEEMKECCKVVIGQKFPEVEVKTTHGVIKLPDYYVEKGKWFVLFSHPADFTPVCTTEFVGFQKRYDQFRELNCELIGLSIDQVFSHIKWVEWIKEKLGVEIEFPIIADDMGELAKKLGMVSPYKGTNTVRAVFIVDDKGVIRAIIYYPQEIGRNLDEIVRAVKALQTSDKYGVATPANWPENDLLGDKVIIPPASSIEEKKQREEACKKGEIECYDWWFCYKKLE